MIPRSGPIARRVRPTRKRAKPRRQPNLDPAYRQWIRECPCALLVHSDLPHRCEGPVECCHVRTKRLGGDRANVIPMCWRAHRVQHQRGIKTFQQLYGIDMRLLAEGYDAVYQRRCDPFTDEGAA